MNFLLTLFGPLLGTAGRPHRRLAFALLTVAALLGAACTRTVPFDTKLAQEALDADKGAAPLPPTPDSTGSIAATTRDTLTTLNEADAKKAPSLLTAKTKEAADKLTKEKAQAKKDRRELGRKAESAIKKLAGKRFLGKRMKKGYARTGGGKSAIIEKFSYLRDYEEPHSYAPAKYYYHRRKHKIFKAAVIDPKVALILHGPYEKRQNGVVIESGYFYVGTKHLRWERNAVKDNILLSKVHWEKGFPRDARITYYDAGRKKIEEVIPYASEKLEGDYVRFLANGQLDWTGEFQGGRHVGLWTNYWGFRNRRRYQWQYPETEFEPDAAPFLLREYNRNGTLIFEKGKVDKRALNEQEERRAGAPRGKPTKVAKVADPDEGETASDADVPAEAAPTKTTTKGKAKPEKGAKPVPQPVSVGKTSADSTTAPAPSAPTRPTAEQARERIRRQTARPTVAPRKQP